MKFDGAVRSLPNDTHKRVAYSLIDNVFHIFLFGQKTYL